MWVHRICGTLILFATFIMGFLGIKSCNWQIQGGKGNVHNIMGFIVLLFVLFITVGGVFTRSMMNRIKWNTALILKIKTGHRVKYLVNIYRYLV